MIVIILVKQTSYNGCALACLDMIFLAKGINLTRAKLNILTGNKKILTLKDFVIILSKYGIKTSVFYSKSHNLVDVKPYGLCLFHHKNHYFIVRSLDDGLFEVFDPAKVRIRIFDSKKLSTKWDGYFLTIGKEVKSPLLIRPFFANYQFKLVLIDIVLIIVFIFYVI